MTKIHYFFQDLIKKTWPLVHISINPTIIYQKYRFRNMELAQLFKGIVKINQAKI